MAMTVLNNTSAMMTLGELNKNINRVGKDLKKVSTGTKITSAQDDASGYAISERMRVMMRSLGQDEQNVKNGRFLLHVAAGGIDNIVEELRNLKKLALNAANDHNTDADRATIQKEFDQKMANINDIASETNYNGKILLDGRYGKTYMPISTSTSTETITTTVEDYTLIPRGDYTISSDGVYMLASDYSGTVSISDSAKNVKIKQQGSAAVENAFIVGPPSGGANLWIDGLNIANTTDRSAIQFQGVDNVLTLKGSNVLQSKVPNSDTSEWESPVIHIGDGLAIQSADAGTLDLTFGVSMTTWENRAGIGLNAEEDNETANLLLYNATISAKMVRSDNDIEMGVSGGNQGKSCVMIGAPWGARMGDITVYGGDINIRTHGAGIGSGESGRVNNIVLDGSTSVDIKSSAGAGIGSGYTGRASDILIDHATVHYSGYSSSGQGGSFADGASAIGSGNMGRVRDIYIGNSSNISSSITGSRGADIGAGYFGYVRNIVIGTLAEINADIIGLAPHESAYSGYAGEQTGTTTYENLNLSPNVVAPNVTEPSSGTTTTTETITHTATTGGFEGNPLVIHHGPKANQALNVYINDMRTDAMGLSGTKVTTRESAIQALSDDSTDPPRIGAIDAAIEYALNEATNVGAYMSRLEYTEENIVTANENTQASESTIRDADMAQEMMSYAKDNVLAQAAQSMLAQANQTAGNVLSLLQ